MKYKNYKIEKSGDNYRILDPSGGYLEEVAVNIQTAKKWIDWDIAEKREAAEKKVS